MGLQKFSSNELLLSKEEAYKVLLFFFEYISIQSNQITDSDRAFAQSLLVEAIDSSQSMGYVEDIFNKFFLKVPTSFAIIKDLAKAFARRAAKNWWKKATGKHLADPKIYDSVRVTLARNFKSAWSIREQTDEPVLY